MAASRKLYVAVAAAMRKQLELADKFGPINREAVEDTVKVVAEEFKKDNPAFDRIRFLQASGVPA